MQNITAVSCTALEAGWRNTITTTTTFPVVPGTVVEVKCSDSGAINEGSSTVTCSSLTQFTYVKEPSCSTPGKVNEVHSKYIAYYSSFRGKDTFQIHQMLSQRRKL